MARKWYAAHRVYGVRVVNTNGARADSLQVFDSKQSRDRWVAKSPDYREALSRQEAWREWPKIVDAQED
jgi:hypothetical protein